MPWDGAFSAHDALFLRLGPLLFGWLLSMLFATDRDFIIYSFEPLLRALAFNGIALVALAALALGVSALVRRPQLTVAIWMAMWIGLGTVAQPPRAPDWIKRSSFTRNLNEVRQEFFRLDAALTDVGLEGIVLERPMGSLSGGERTRVGMARLAIAKPDLLLLDEPTNHLDIEGQEDLEDQLGKNDVSCLFVSHDRFFTRSVATRFLEIRKGRLIDVEDAEAFFDSQADRVA